MKIVIFSRFPEDTSSPRGGVETATLGLVRGLTTFGDVELHVVTLEKNRRKLLIEEKEGLQIHRLPGSKWPMFFDVIAGPGRRLIQKYIESLKPDVAHFQETYGLGLNDLTSPMIFTVHGFDSLNLVAQRNLLWWIRSRIWKRVEAFGLKKQKYIVSITPYVRNKIEMHTEAKIFDIDNAISEQYFHIPRNEIPGRIFFAGWLNPRKNALGLVKSFAKVLKSNSDAHLHIAGEAKNKEYLYEIENTIEKLSLTNKVKLLGRINQGELRKELSEASIFVLPSKQENAPMVIAEAMAAGVPVISSNVCGMPYMIKNDETGYLINPHNLDELTNSIVFLLNNDSRRNMISKAARREAESRYHPKSVAEKTLDAYRFLINCRKNN